MGDVIDFEEYKRRKLSRQFDEKPKKKPKKAEIRERKANELEESYARHPSQQKSKPKKPKNDDQ